MKTFALQKTIKKMRRQATGREKMLINYICDKGPVLRICKEL